jgi:hypothetical protein
VRRIVDHFTLFLNFLLKPAPSRTTNVPRNVGTLTAVEVVALVLWQDLCSENSKYSSDKIQKMASSQVKRKSSRLQKRIRILSNY